MIVGVLLPHTYRVTKYDPADRDEHGRYTGAEGLRSDHGLVEAAYLASVASFARESGMTCLGVREPGLEVVNFGLEPTIDGYGLAGLFPPDLTGFHDGARVPVMVGLELVRAMLRGNGAFCRLEAEDRFFVHVGFDQHVYVGSAVPCELSVALAHDRGLFAEPVVTSPLAAEFTDDGTSGTRQPADAAWWARLAALVTQRGTVMLEEGYVLNASRWHLVAAADVDTVQARLAPRSRVLVWPDLSADVDTVVAGLAPDDLIEVVWQDSGGRITSRLVDEGGHAGLAALLAGAGAALVVPQLLDQRHPLLAGVLPDADGVLRARWPAE
jgi:small subunit ribosomal protein S1